MKYQDFISVVRDADPETYWEQNKGRAKKNFQFTDIEVGKIYVFRGGDTAEITYDSWYNIWFMMPTKIESNQKFRLYWIYYTKWKGRVIIGGEADESESAANTWDHHVWDGKDWLVLDIIPPFKYLNWTNNPFGVKS